MHQPERRATRALSWPDRKDAAVKATALLEDSEKKLRGHLTKPQQDNAATEVKHSQKVLSVSFIAHDYNSS